MSLIGTVLGGLAGGGAAAPIDALGEVFDKLFTSDEERLQARAVLEKLRQHPAEMQVALNRAEAGHRTVFVAGWRPFIGWIAGAGLAWSFLGHPLFEWAAALWFPGVEAPAVASDQLFELVVAMLGLSGLRTFEKATGVSR